MIQLFLIISFLVAVIKPEIMVAKKIRDNMTENEKDVVVTNNRKIYLILLIIMVCWVIKDVLEKIFLKNSDISLLIDIVTIGAMIAAIVALVVIVIPVSKENKKIIKDVEERNK